MPPDDRDCPMLHTLDGSPVNVWSRRNLVAIEYANVWLHFNPRDALRVAGLLIAAADYVIDNNPTERNHP